MSHVVVGMHHAAISVRDVDVSVRFYEKLGFQKTNHYVDPEGVMQIIQMELGGVGLEVFWYQVNQAKPALELGYANEPELIGVKHICLRVNDADEALSWLKDVGLATPDTEIKIARSLANSRYFFIRDPDGMWVEFIEDNGAAHGGDTYGVAGH